MYCVEYMSRVALGSQIVSPFQLDAYNLSLPFSKDRVSDPNFLSYNRSGSHHHPFNLNILLQLFSKR